MSTRISFYDYPSSMEPMYPTDTGGVLAELAAELIRKAGRLSGTSNSITRAAIAEFIRPMNSYYSNLIEGHDTHPLDIERALKGDFSNDKKKRNLQEEAKAHISLHREISLSPSIVESPASTKFLCSVHKRFYEHLPEHFLKIESKEGVLKTVHPGEYRRPDEEVQVGKHIAPLASSVPSFMDRFEKSYAFELNATQSKIDRIVNIAASHHRLVWIHPFLDGNGRVVRLFSDACFMNEELDASGMWSVSRGLARNNTEYYERLANADMSRHGDLDGRGNLSNKMLVEFCTFFLTTAIDQLDYMFEILDVGSMLHRINNFSALMTARHGLRPEIKHILSDVFLKGKITKSDAIRITDTSDKTLKLLTDKLAEMGLIEPIKEGIEMTYHVRYPIKYSPMLFPGAFPSGKEVEMMNAFA